jgi:hypothetical protein
LKLADVSGVWQALRGDQLLRADKKLAEALEGVYRRGPIYLRWPQSLSSLAFGTDIGRFLTQYVVLPYGSAFVAIEGSGELAISIAHFFGQLEQKKSFHDLGSNMRLSIHSAEFVLGTLMLLLIHRPHFRRWMFQVMLHVGKFLRLVFVDWPTKAIHSPFVQRILQSQSYAVIRNYVLRPAIFSAILLLPMFTLKREASNWDFALEIFLAMNLFLNSPLGRYADERVTDVIMRAWHELRMRVFQAVYQWIMDVFHQLLEGVERVLYAVDEWLRYRRGDSRLFLVVKGLLGSIWSVVRYLIRIYVTLLIEPQVNPIKHFPVVTVSHKLMLPASYFIAKNTIPYLEPFMGTLLAGALVGTNLILLPGVFGFLVWELKENWRLFEANRPRTLVPSRIGPHGETMNGLLHPGFHSGTLSKLYARLRRAARKANETGDWKPVNQRRAALHHVEERLHRFFDRELCALLEQDATISQPDVCVGAIELATNRVDVEFTRADMASAWLAVEERQGWLVAYLRQLGWIEQLPAEQRLIWEAGLAGVYKLLAIDVVREHVDQSLGATAASYEVVSDGIAAYTDGSPEHRILYRLRKGRSRITPLSVDGQVPPGWPVLSIDHLVFRELPIEWSAWVDFWSRPAAERLTGLLVPMLVEAQQGAA